MKYLLYTAVIGLTLLTTGCDNTKKPTKEVFKQALDQYYSSQPQKAISLGCALPISIPNGSDPNSGPPELEALVSVGLAKKGDCQVYVRHDYVAGRMIDNQNVPGKKYELTDLGQKYYVSTGFGDRVDGGFNYGVYRVDEVTLFTEPSDAHPVSEVRFTYSVQDIPDWARHPAMTKAFRFLNEDLQQHFEDTKRFVLTNEGWQLAR